MLLLAAEAGTQVQEIVGDLIGARIKSSEAAAFRKKLRSRRTSRSAPVCTHHRIIYRCTSAGRPIERQQQHNSVAVVAAIIWLKSQ